MLTTGIPQVKTIFGLLSLYICRSLGVNLYKENMQNRKKQTPLDSLFILINFFYAGRGPKDVRHRRSYMSARVFLNLLNKLGKSDKM